MNILYIIGNGFDIAQNIKTSFTDFLKYYTNRSIDGRVAISSLKASITEDINTWADFEKQFGLYTSSFDTIEQYQEVIDDIRDNLEAFLIAEREKFILGPNKSEKFLKDLFNPVKYLFPSDKNSIHFSDNYPNVNIVTFNYTDTIEKVIGNDVPFEYSRTMMSSEIVSSLIHVHGTLGETILFGVNDVSQIANEDLSKSTIVQNELIKPVANYGMHNTINESVEHLIGTSDLIILFGTSIGETDNKWWELIGKRLKSKGAQLIYFVKSDFVYNSKKAYKYGIECDKQKSFLCARLGISEKSDILENIVVCPNSEMFQLNQALPSNIY